MRAFFFGDSKALVGEIGLSHVEEALSGHGRIGDTGPRREQRKALRRAGRTFPGCSRRTSHNDRQRVVELAARCGQITDQLIGFLTDYPGCSESVRMRSIRRGSHNRSSWQRLRSASPRTRVFVSDSAPLAKMSCAACSHARSTRPRSL